MIHYYIPDFFWHYHVNLKLLELMRDEPQMFYDDFKIGAVFGNFPNCIWNGGRPVFGRHVDVTEMELISDQFNSFGVPLRLTMTNRLINEQDCWDRYSNYIMKNLHNGINQVLVANPILEKHIREKYSKYPIVRSILLSINDSSYNDNDYHMTVLSSKKNQDFDLLKSIQNKNKIELLVNEQCEVSCPMHEHYERFERAQLYLTTNTENLSCRYTPVYRKDFYNHPYCITREKIKEIYEPMGFQHFKIQGRGYEYTAKVVFDYAHYMVKPEWKEDFILIMMGAVIADNR